MTDGGGVGASAPTPYREKLESLSFRAVKPGAKVTTDVHDTHKVDVTEHWNDRVDVTVRPDTVHRKFMAQEG